MGSNKVQKSRWATSYAFKHHWHRVLQFPAGIAAPKKVRIYQRCNHYLLQVWDPAVKANVTERVDGDLVSAISRSRLIEDRISQLRSTGCSRSVKFSHADLVDRYEQDLQSRVNAGEIDIKTQSRYQTALRPYRAFCETESIAKRYRLPSLIDREFRLAFQAYLNKWRVTKNGHQSGDRHPLKSAAYVLATVRALYEWAADPDRGNLLPSGFRNPFIRGIERAKIFHGDPLAAPDITISMSEDFFATCTSYELRLFIPLILFGLRASEPAFLFHEHLQPEWLMVPNIEGLEYRTKGRREKRFPLDPAHKHIWDFVRNSQTHGILYQRERVVDGAEKAPLQGYSLNDLMAEFQLGCRRLDSESRSSRRHLRNQLLKDAGSITYDDIESHFKRIAKLLNWPARATLKDFRHLFATTLASSGMAESYRKYLMGHAPSRDAIVAYTHVSDLSTQFHLFCQAAWKPLVQAVEMRLHSLNVSMS